jgi:hypothetical protein
MAKVQKGQVLNPNGRPAGTKNKLSLKDAQEAQKKYGVKPLDFFMVHLNDPRMPRDFKFECAKAAAPYVHRKMPIAIDDGNGGPVSFASPEQLAKLPTKDLKMLTEILGKLKAIKSADESVGIVAGMAVQQQQEDDGDE